MRCSALLLALTLVPVLAGAQGETYGKTEAQMLAMGEDKWDAFYMAKAGTSTMAMSQMNELYGLAEEHRNDRLIKKAPKSLKASVEKLRGLLTDFASNAVMIGYNIDGGGTMWTPVSADIGAKTELVLFALLGGKTAKPHHTDLASVGALLNVLSKTINETRTDKDGPQNFNFVQTHDYLAKMRAEFAQIATVLKRLDRANSDRVLGFCQEFAKLAKGDWS